MTTTQPEAETEYSTTPGGENAPGHRHGTGLRAVLSAGLAGAGLLLAAELTPLFRLDTIAPRPRLVRTIETGPHHGWALVPIAVLAGALAVAAYGGRERGRLAPGLIALLGLAALGVALLADLPHVHATGIVGSPATGLHDAWSHAAIGLYLETLGAFGLLLAGGAGALLTGRRKAETRGLPAARDRGLRRDNPRVGRR